MLKVDEAKFLQIKSFLGEPYNTDYKTLAKLFNLSIATIYNIQRSEDYKGYKTLITKSIEHLKKDFVPEMGKQQTYPEHKTWNATFTYTFVFKWGASFKPEKVFITVNAQTHHQAEMKAGQLFTQNFPNIVATRELNSIKDFSRE